MIDGVNIMCTEAGQGLLNNPLLEFGFNGDVLTGEIRGHSAEFRGLRITVHPSGALKARGSLHRLKNNGIHNYDNFPYSESHRVISGLETDLMISPETAQITKLEVGVNITPHIPVADLLMALMLHKSRVFNSIREPDKYHKYVNYSEYGVKAYDKGLQYNRPEQIFRFEIVLRKSKLKSTGVQTLADLKKPGIYNDLGELLISEFDRCIIIDSPDFKNLNNRQASNIRNWMNPNYWYTIKDIPDSIKRLQNFSRAYNIDKTHKIISNLIAEQVSKNQDYKSFRPPFLTKGETVDFSISSPPLFNHLNKGEISTPQPPQEKTCVITGLDISMQDPGSKYITPVGLNYYKDNSPEKYKEVIADFGPYDNNLDQDTNFYRISHRIRNYTSNQWRDLRTMQEKYKGNYSLFENNWLYGDRAILALLCNKKNNATCHSNQE